MFVFDIELEGGDVCWVLYGGDGDSYTRGRAAADYSLEYPELRGEPRVCRSAVTTSITPSNSASDDDFPEPRPEKPKCDFL